MADRDGEFERRLQRDLREWTDPAAGARNWTDDARTLIAAGGPARGPSRWRLVALSAAATVLAAAAGVVVLDLDPFGGQPAGSATPQPSDTAASLAPTGTPQPATLDGSQLELSRLAWWDQQGYGFGIIPEDPNPSPAAMPPSAKQVRIGTLDGRITAVLTLSDEWSHSYISGPVGTDVLVVNDDGTTSTIWLVSALDGSRTAVKASNDEIVAAAALSPAGDEVYYIKIDRRTGIDQGLWQLSTTARGIERPILQGPLGEPLEELSVWQVLTSLDGTTVIVQSCFGEVRCTSYFVDMATGTSRQLDSIGWPRGMADDELLARGGPDIAHLVAVNLVTLEIRTLLPDLPEAMPVRVGDRWFLAYATGTGGLGPTRLLALDDNAEASIPGDGEDLGAMHALSDRFGIHLPAGWVIRGPDPEVFGYRGPDQNLPPRQLINVATGERVTLDPFAWVVANDSCLPIAPSEMPDGQGVGPGIETLETGVLFAKWGSDANAVLQGVAYAATGSIGGPEVTIRGVQGTVLFVGEAGTSEVVIEWEEDGCAYTVWFPAGTSIDEARAYAGRY